MSLGDMSNLQKAVSEMQCSGCLAMCEVNANEKKEKKLPWPY